MLDRIQRERLTQALERIGVQQTPDQPDVQDEVEAIESFLGATLPADCRWFLLNHGEVYIGSMMLPGEGGRAYPVRSFYGAKLTDGRRLSTVTDIFSDDLDPAEMPIGNDVMGDQMTLYAPTGKIGYLWIDEGSRSLDIAASFTDLVEQLVPYDE